MVTVSAGRSREPKLPRVTAREAERATLRDGWYTVGGSGGHRQFRHATKRGRITIPMHSGGDLPPGTVKSIIGQASLTVQHFIDLL